MAVASTYYLKGGPCAGKTGELTPAEEQSQQITCGGHIYKEDAADNSQRPAIVFKDTGAVPAPPKGGGTPHTHKGWSDVQHSVNVNLRHALNTSQRNTSAALRSLSRSRKVKL